MGQTPRQAQVTVSETVVLCDCEPEVPVTVTVEVLGGVPPRGALLPMPVQPGSIAKLASSRIKAGKVTTCAA